MDNINTISDASEGLPRNNLEENKKCGQEQAESTAEELNDKTLITEETDEAEAEDKVKMDAEDDLNENMKNLGLEENLASKNDEETKLTTLSKFLSIAVKGKEGQREILMNKGYGEFLVFCLMDESVNVVRSVMEVLEVLVSNRRNHKLLQELAYFMSVLESFEKKRGMPDDLKQDALKIHRTLQTRRLPLNDRHNNTMNQSSSVKSGYSTLDRSKMRNGVETVFVIHHGVLQQAYGRNRIAKELIKVKGIISVTYDPLKNHCIVRRKRTVDASLFGSAIANLGYEVSMMCRNEAKDWILIPVTADTKNVSQMQENMPEYLPEEDDAVVGENVLCRPGTKDPNDNESSLLDSAKSFLRRSFFW